MIVSAWVAAVPALRARGIAALAWSLFGLCGLCCIAAPVHGAEREARVLILNGADPYLPSYLVIDGAMRARLASEPGGPRVALFSETLDVQRFPLERLETEYLAFLARKYSSLQVDVVVAVTGEALAFYLRHGERLWPGARLVYQGFSGVAAWPAALPPGARSVMPPDDIAATVDLVRRLHPGASRAIVITGVADLDRRYEAIARRVLAAKAPALPVDYLSGLPLEELLAKVAAAPADAFVLVLPQFRDRNGRPYVPLEVGRQVARASTPPVYGTVQTLVGVGAVAVNAESLEDRGRLVAQQVLSALAGGPPDPARVTLQSAIRCVADARAIKRWKVDESVLPPSCEIRFAERSFWREYLWIGLGSLLVILAQALLIATLLAQMRRRRAAEAESRKRFSEMAHMNRRVALGEMSASLAHELSQPLGAIMSNAGAARLLLKAGPDRLPEIAEILDDIISDDQRANEIIARVRRMLKKGDFEAVDIDLNATIDETTRLLAEEAMLRGVTFVCTLDDKLPQVRADPVEVRQVIVNIALNAMEAMDGDAKAQRRLWIRSRQANRDEAEVSVGDSGSGISAELLPRIFDAFVTSKHTGMGLGLAISRTIVETHGGSIRAENGPDGGAIVSFTLPFAAVQA